jgi:hypothetical protein
MKKWMIVVLALFAVTVFAEQYTLQGRLKLEPRHGFYSFSSDEWWFKVFPENAPGVELSELPQGDVTITIESDEIRTLASGKQAPKNPRGWTLISITE